MAAAAPLLLLFLVLLLSLRCSSQDEDETVRSQESPRLAGEPLRLVKELPRRAAEDQRSPKKKTPQFMMDLFNNGKVLDGAVVRSFEGRTRNRFHFFNLSSLHKEERTIKAEFRWFRKTQKFYPGVSRFSHFYKVCVYEAKQQPGNPQRGELLSSRLLPLHTQGWEVFNVTQMVSKWIQKREDNGFLVVTSLPRGNWRRSSVRIGQQRLTKAFLVVFSDDKSAASLPPFMARQPMGAVQAAVDHGGRGRRSASSLLPPADPADPASCRRVPLYIDFEEMGWSSWIISPRGYNANRCDGSCLFPLGGGVPATNHATVLSIMHALRLSGGAAEPPCCVPEQLDSISLLYFDSDENVVLRQYEHMVAVSCGCH